MKFLHTSDWHLGRSFHGLDVTDIQQQALQEIVAWVQAHGIDVVLVSGDVYDRAQPRTEVVELLNRALAEIREAGAYVVLSSGNHDSAVRLGFGAKIMAHGGVFLRTRWQEAHHPVVFTQRGGKVTAQLRDPGRQLDSAAGERDHSKSGSSIETQVAVYGIPYMEPRSAASLLEVEATHHQVLSRVMKKVRDDREGRGPERAIVMAHAFVTGAEPSESERILDSGGLGTVGASIFEGVDYAALGHLHGRQSLTPEVRYSGSPVAYSFSETGHTKGAWLVEVHDSQDITVTALDHTCGLELASLRGTLEELLTSERYESATSAWCQVVLTDQYRPKAAMERIKVRFPHAVSLAWEPEGGRLETQTTYTNRVRGAKSPEELCGEFFEHVRQRPVDSAEQVVITDAVAAAMAQQHAE